MSREDYIIQEPEPLMIVEDKKQLKAYNDPKFAILLDLLRKGPMPIKEITFEYNKHVSKPKSEITIYNYIKSLQDVDLVIKAGQRLIRGSTAATQLYSRKALLMIPMTMMSEGFWDTENGKELLNTIRQLLAFYTGESPVDTPNFKKLLIHIYSIPTEKLKGYVTNYSDSLRAIFTGSSQEEVREVINLFSLVMILLESEQYDMNLKTCFP